MIVYWRASQCLYMLTVLFSTFVVLLEYNEYFHNISSSQNIHGGKVIILPFTAQMGSGGHWHYQVTVDMILTCNHWNITERCLLNCRQINYRMNVNTTGRETIDCVFVFVDIPNNSHHFHHTLNCEQPNRSDAIIHRAGTSLSPYWLNGKQNGPHWCRLFAA